MTSDLLATSQLLLAELQATEAYLRVAAARVLPYAKMLEMERRAARTCAGLLARLSVQPGMVPFDPESIVITVQQPAPVDSSAPPRKVHASPAGAPRAPSRTPAPAPSGGRTPTVTASAPKTEDVEDQLTAVQRDRGRAPSSRTSEPPPRPAAPTPAPAPRPRSTPPPAVRSRPPGAPSVATSPAPASTRATPARSAPRQQARGQSFVSFDDSTGANDVETVVYGDDGRVVGDVPPNRSTAPSPDDEATMVKAAETRFGEAERTPAAPEHASAQVRVGARPSASPPRSPSTSGLYGGGGTAPSVRGGDSGRPRAAAIQLNATGTGGRMVVDHEDEPIEIGAAEDYDDVEFEEGGGFAISLREEGGDDLFGGEDHDDEGFADDSDPSREPLEAVAQMIEEPTRPTADEISSVLSQAQSVAATGNLQGAADLYSDVIDAEPEHAPAHVSRGRLYLDLGDYSRAMSDFMVAEDLAPDDPEPQVAIGDLYFARKDYRRAIDYFNAALEMSPNHAMAFCRRGISHYYRKNYREALDDLLRAEDIEPEIPNITTYVSMARKKAGRR